MHQPTQEEYAPFYYTYVQKVPEGTIIESLKSTFDDFMSFVDGIDDSKADYRYAEGKWSLKELLQHLVDTERVMAYRAMRIARRDSTPLSGFDENDYAANATVSHRSMTELLEELHLVRSCSIALFQSFTTDDLLRLGTASSQPVSVRALGYIIIGHLLHHQSIIKERYL